MRVLTVKLPDELGRELDYAVTESGVSKSNFVREAIAHYIVHPKQKRKRFVSALALAGDIVGSIARSPRGLASDPKLLIDFGKD
jgi:metal-responsive CopG/Arc/MetJ family transcriptional regulator